MQSLPNIELIDQARTKRNTRDLSIIIVQVWLSQMVSGIIQLVSGTAAALQNIASQLQDNHQQWITQRPFPPTNPFEYTGLCIGGRWVSKPHFPTFPEDQQQTLLLYGQYIEARTTAATAMGVAYAYHRLLRDYLHGNISPYTSLIQQLGQAWQAFISLDQMVLFMPEYYQHLASCVMEMETPTSDLNEMFRRRQRRWTDPHIDWIEPGEIEDTFLDIHKMKPSKSININETALIQLVSAILENVESMNTITKTKMIEAVEDYLNQPDVSIDMKENAVHFINELQPSFFENEELILGNTDPGKLKNVLKMMSRFSAM